LIVDDEAEIRNGISQYFPWHEIGFEVVDQCENGKQALQYIDNHAVDVVLCDIKMPIMSGLELAKLLYDRKSSIKILFLSGYRDFEYAKQALAYDVKNYIVKPTKFDELFKIFSELKVELDEASPNLGAELSSQLTFNEKVIAEIKSYVEENLHVATLEEAARRVHMNSYYVSKYFKEKTGQKFSDFIVSMKMEKASELLMDIHYKTYEVSEMVGYTNAKNFTRTFKKYYGKSPREFRNSQESNDYR